MRVRLDLLRLARQLVGRARVLLHFALRGPVDELEVRIGDHGLLEVRVDAVRPPRYVPVSSSSTRVPWSMSHSTLLFRERRAGSSRVSMRSSMRCAGLPLPVLRRITIGLPVVSMRVEPRGADADALLAAGVVARQRPLTSHEVLKTGYGKIIDERLLAAHTSNTDHAQESQVRIGERSHHGDVASQIGKLLVRDVLLAGRSEIAEPLEVFREMASDPSATQIGKLFQSILPPDFELFDERNRFSGSRRPEPQPGGHHHAIRGRRDKRVIRTSRRGQESDREHPVPARGRALGAIAH